MDVRNLILLGSGITHLAFLKKWMSNPLPGWRVSWISSNSFDVPLPEKWFDIVWGIKRNSYDHINPRQIAQIANIRFIEADIEAIDSKNKKIMFKNWGRDKRPDMFFDHLSIDSSSFDILSPDIFLNMGQVGKVEDDPVLLFNAQSTYELSFFGAYLHRDKKARWKVTLSEESFFENKTPSINLWFKKLTHGLAVSIDNVNELGSSPKKEEFTVFEPIEKKIKLWAKPFLTNYYSFHGFKFYDDVVSVMQRPFYHLVNFSVISKYNSELFKCLCNKKHTNYFEFKKSDTFFRLDKNHKSYPLSFFYFAKKRDEFSQLEQQKLFDFFKLKIGSYANDLNTINLAEPKSQAISHVEPNQPVSFTFGSSFSLFSDPYYLGEVIALRGLSECYSRGIEPKSSEWFLSHTTSFSVDDVRQFYAGIASVLEESQVDLKQAQSFNSPNLSWYAHFSGMQTDNTWIYQKPLLGDHLILTGPIGFATAWSNQAFFEFPHEGIRQVFLNLKKNMNEAFNISKKFRVSSVKTIGIRGVSGACLDILEGQEEKALVNMRKIPRVKGVNEFISRDPSVVAPQTQANWNELKPRVNFSLEEVSHQNDCLWMPEINGGWLIAVNPEDSKSMLIEFQKAGFSHATIFGCIGKSNNQEKISLSDWDASFI